MEIKIWKDTHQSPMNGLTKEQVEIRVKEKNVNYDLSLPTKSIKQILYENFFTLFNFLNLFLAIIIFMVGSYKNMLFLAIVIINTSISTIQEIHSKKIIDKLSVLAESKANVIRDSKKIEIPIDEIVLDDIIEFKTGNQVATDSIIQDGEVLVNESFITGEPNSITKKAGNMILSGSFIISGHCLAKVEHVGIDNYASKISSGAKYVKKFNSEIMISLQKIIRFLTFAIIPIGLALFVSQFYFQKLPIDQSVIHTVAAIIGMIPEGLVLLTSTVLAISVIRLSKSKVLVQDLYCIETLARVDTLCLDKTGTLTKGDLEVVNIIKLTKNRDNNLLEDDTLENVLANLAKFSEDENPTIMAIKNRFQKLSSEFSPIKKVAFSSERKWSGISFKNTGSYIIGAPSFVLGNDYNNYKNEIKKYSKDYRVLIVAHSENNFENNSLPKNIVPIALVLLIDTLRENVNQTLKYFYKQNVDIKIISGDNPLTVSQIAKHAGVKKYDNFIDMTTVSDDELENVALKYSIFGRVSPTQKLELVKALQRNGKTVAMTGDGVNDVLALKQADCSVAMANGSDATKNVSQLILLNSDFSSMPKVVAEGRRTINNIQRSASLFLVKTIYSCLLALMSLLMQENYPFVPIQLSLISFVTIGTPSFLLALEPNKEKITGSFLKNILKKALPTGLICAISIFFLTLLSKFNIIETNKLSTLCIISTGFWGLLLLFSFSKSRKNEESSLPFSIYRLLLAICMTIIFIFAITYFSAFFNINL